jgi:2-dehydro-3-deoxyphosphogluconate aldolase/(4S)-4-hydroxy-2-oxoglutarate aldolase
MVTKQEVLDQIRRVGIVPVIRAQDPNSAAQAAAAVCEGGIPVVEITMTVPGAVDVIRKLARSLPEALVGTVLDRETAERCLDAGAHFLVSPGFDRETVEAAKSRGVPMMAGALTPTEVITAWRAGSDIVKVFPCGNVGGPSYIKALKAALPQIPLLPTGGVNLKTTGPFFEAGSIAVGVGSELVSAGAMARGDYAGIAAGARAFVQAVQEARRNA